ncbi:Ribosome recycling factor domain [Lasallia pustulata]|uniref:Ribosome recycling factor domain n=1 Tax=Lasallia pustulata TaxID=136370 RepID=A0A1W5DAI7_9LECA|nr:Ribosome recycling factor domain [Lasallia pustulata]
MPPRLDLWVAVISRKPTTGPCSSALRHNFSSPPLICSPTQQPNRCPVPPPSTTSPRRHLSSTPTLLKRSGKHEPRAADAVPTEKPKDDDPFDFSDLEEGIQKALERLKDGLGRLRAGGRFNPEVLEMLRVMLRKGEAAETVRLGDLAQVLPKGGRTVVVLVGEEEHIKPISRTILASPHSLNPIPSPTNPFELHVAIPPPTKESRMQVLAAASKAGETAAHTVQEARGRQQKKLRAMKLARKAGPDALRKAGEKMEKVVQKGSAEVKKVVEGARRVLEQG